MKCLSYYKNLVLNQMKDIFQKLKKLVHMALIVNQIEHLFIVLSQSI